MLKFFVAFLCVLNAFQALTQGGNVKFRSDRSYGDCANPCRRRPDFYWRQYTGEIPEDALIGGSDQQGYNVYVGQTLYGGTDALIPANIFIGQKAALSSVHDRNFTYELDVKILCAQSRNDYRWVPTSVELISRMPHPVPGGTEVQKRVYIGRVFLEGRHIIGKIFGNNETNKGLWIPKPDGGVLNLFQFDILVYEPKLTKIN